MACRRVKGFKRGDKTPPSPTNRKNLRRRRISMNFDELWTNKDEESTLKFEKKDGSDIPLHVEAPDLAEKEMPKNWIGFKEGVLLKQGTGWFGKKKERYFRFRNQYMTIYKTKDAEHPHSSFNVERITSVVTEKRKEIRIAFEKPVSERELFVKKEEEAMRWKQAIESRQRWLKDRRKQQRERLKIHGLRMTRFAGHVRAVGHLKARARGARERLKKRKEEYERRKREEERKRREEEERLRREKKEEEERLKREREAEEERKRKEREEEETNRLKEQLKSQSMRRMRQRLSVLKNQGVDEEALKKAKEEEMRRHEEELKRQMELAEERNRIVC